MAKYTGRRIVPKHAGEWNIRKEYEELQIVLDTESGNSYISNLPVPKGTALTDEKYWSLYSLYSEQIAEAEEHLTQTAGDIRMELSETEGRINESLSSTESKVNTSLSETENRVTARVENAKTGQYTGKGVFTIVAESAGAGSTKGWGKLKSGAGWVSLDFCTRVG